MSQQEDLIKSLAQYGGPIFKDFQEQKMTVQKFEIEKDSEIKQAEFVIINKMDHRDKWYKGATILLCLIALVVVSFFDKLQGVSPIIGVIIGLVLKSNSINDFLGTSKSSDSSE